ncbi:MAG: hypothetical protein JWO81_1737 [Alphaproteobacteria bacterium]|nr:hypothetical protein [Alphaproteobacteria bacterium]
MHVFTADLQAGDGTIPVLVAQHSAGQSLEALFEALYTDYAEARLGAAWVVLRPDVRDRFPASSITSAIAPTDDSDLSDSPFLTALREARADPEIAFARLLDTPVVVLHADGDELRVSGNVNPAAPDVSFAERGVDEGAILSALRAKEMSCLVERSRALLPVIPGSFYRAPSNRLARAFLRVGNIQYSRHAIDAVCFWLLPYTHGCEAVLVDTWSISSIAFDLASLMAALRGGSPIPVEMLSQYQDRSPERMALAAEALDRISAELGAGASAAEDGPPVKVACILSATHSGSLVEVLQGLVEMSEFGLELSFVALFQMGTDLGIPSLSDISDTPEFRPLTPGEEESRTVVDIDPRSYFPLSHADVELCVRVRHAQAAKAFMDVFSGKDVISVHRDHKTDGPTRHQAFHVDTERLVATDAFREGTAAKLLALVPHPSLIVTPAHAAAHALGAFASAVLSGNGPVPHYEHSTLSLRGTEPERASDEALRAMLLELGPEDAILVLDDAFITGSRLSGYQNRLRAMSCRARVHYHVAVARPSDPAAWNQARSMLSWRGPADRSSFPTNTVDATFEICLPNWQERECPWCAEQRLYDAIVARGQVLPSFFAARRARLVEGRERGLTMDAALQDGCTPPMRLERSSIFAPEGASQAETFAALASAFQIMRTVEEADLPRLGPRRHPLSTVLKSTEYLRDTYTDSILRAAFLRGAAPDELVYADAAHDWERQSLVHAIVSDQAAHVSDVAHELVLAAALGKGDLSEAALEALNQHTGRREAVAVLGVTRR